MFKVPLHNFAYDSDGFLLAQPQNQDLKMKVDKLHHFLLNDFIIDFEHVSPEQLSALEEIRYILHSHSNTNSEVIFHLINYYNINVRRSNKAEENNMLHLLCACGRLEDVIWYLNAYPKVKVNTMNHIMQSPLQFAIAIGNSPEIATYLFLEKQARLSPNTLVANTDDIDDYTVVDALFVQWISAGNSFFATWGAFSDLICDEQFITDLLKSKLPLLYSYCRSDMVLK